MEMPMLTAPTDLAAEIQQLQADLATAQLQRLSAADRRVLELQQALTDKEFELRQREEAEATTAAEQRHAEQLQSLVQLEKAIDSAKNETVTLKAMLTELPQRLSRAQWELSQLLRQHALLKADLQMKG